MILTRALGEGAGLCPMAGVTDVTFRLNCREMGAAFSTTEMVSARGYLLSPGHRAGRAAFSCMRSTKVRGRQLSRS
jgi:tRNA-dihydrouridine synthase